MKKYTSILFIALSLLSLMLLAGCGGIISRPKPLQIIVLDSSQEADLPSCTQPLPVQIVVPTPFMSSGLNTERIAILLNNREVHYMADYKWDDSNARLVQRLLIDTINDSNCFIGAGTGSMSLRADYRLEADLKRLHFVYEKSATRPLAEVSFSLRLIEVGSGEIVAQYNAWAQKESGNNLFQSMEEVIQKTMQDSLNWLRAGVSQHLESKESARAARK